LRHFDFPGEGAELDFGDTPSHTIQILKASQKHRGAAGAEEEFFILETRRQGSIY
jgi:hypothetical protein